MRVFLLHYAMTDKTSAIKLNRTHATLLVLINAAFIALILLLGYFNRFASDDYGLIYIKDSFGTVGGTTFMYIKWSTIWTNFLFAFPLMDFLQSSGSLVWYTLLLLVFLLFSACKILCFIFSSFLIKLHWFTLVNYALLFCATFFFLSFNKGESWFWITCSVEYLFSLVVLLLGICAIVSKSKAIFIYPAIALFFTYAGGCVLPLVLVIYTVFFIYGYMFISKKEAVIFKSVYAKRLFIAFLFFAASSVIMFLGEGKEKRMETLPDPSFLTGLIMSFKSIGKMVLYDAPYALPLFILFGIPWFFLGNKLRALEIQFFKSGDLKKIILRSFLLFLILLGLTIFPAAYVLSDTPPYRVWTQVYFGLAVLCCGGGLIFGNAFNFLRARVSVLFISSCIIVLLFISFTIYRQFAITSLYAKAVDKRIELLIKLRNEGNKKLIILEKLPPAGMLYTAEISSDSMHFNNENLKKGLKLNFNVKVE